jgi:hypothetical protein
MQEAKREGSHLAFYDGVEGKLLRSIVNLEVVNHSYSEFVIRNIYQSGALGLILIINCKKQKEQGFPFGLL